MLEMKRCFFVVVLLPLSAFDSTSGAIPLEDRPLTLIEKYNEASKRFDTAGEAASTPDRDAVAVLLAEHWLGDGNEPKDNYCFSVEGSPPSDSVASKLRLLGLLPKCLGDFKFYGHVGPVRSLGDGEFTARFSNDCTASECWTELWCYIREDGDGVLALDRCTIVLQS